MENTKPLVRRCSQCGKAKLICVSNWQHRFAGIDLSTQTLDYRCESCGYEVTLHPQKEIFAERLFAYFLIPAIFPSIYFFAKARRKARAWTDNPVVGGVERRAAGPRARQCICSAAAPCVRIVMRRIGGRRIGKRYEYRCDHCTKAFAVDDVGGVFFWAVEAAVFSAVATPFLVLPGAENNRWFGALFAVLGVACWLRVAFGIRSRARHPEVDL